MHSLSGGMGVDRQGAVELQQPTVMEFFRLNINPETCQWTYPEDPDGCDPASTDPVLACPPFAIKQVDRIVEDDMSGANLWLYFLMMDLVIAIDD